MSQSIWDTLAVALSPAEARPCLVSLIETAEYKTRAGDPYVVLCNARADTYLKLAPRDFALAQLMDGTRSVSQLVVQDFKLYKSFAPPRVLGLVQLLKEKNFLTEPPLDAYASLENQLERHSATSLTRRLAQGFLFTEFSSRRADAFFTALYQAVGWVFFTRPMQVVLVLLAIAAPTFFILEYNRRRYDLFQVGGSTLTGFLLLFGLMWIIIAIHEMGHGLVVKHARRNIPRAGLLIYYGFPAAFVETSDIWMAPPRMRILASLAGPLTGVFIGGLCAIAAFLLPTGPLGAFLFVWGFVALVNNLLNFNPLLELDGYYLLVDLIEKPLLRTRAFAFVRGPLWQKLRNRVPLTREEWFFTAFGLASAAWSVFSIYLALEFWAGQLQPLLISTWTAGDVWSRAALVVFVMLVLLPFAVAGWSALRWLGALIGRGQRYLQKERRAEEALDVLKLSPLWDDLPSAELARVAQAMRVDSVSGGKEVAAQGDPCHRYFIIAHGEFEARVNDKPVKHLTRGDGFGVRALLDQGAHTASVMALKAGRLYSLDIQAFRAALSDDIEVLVQLEAALTQRAEVARLPVFQDLSASELRALVQQMTTQVFETGQIINRADEVNNALYLVRSGRVEVSEEGHEPVVLEASDWFGEDSLLENISHAATVKAMERTEVLVLQASAFKALIESFAAQPANAPRPSHLTLHTHRRLGELGHTHP